MPFLRELDKKLWTSADKLRSNLDAVVYKPADQFAASTNLEDAIKANLKGLGDAL